MGENGLSAPSLQRWHPSPVINGSINKVWLRGDLQIYDFLSPPADVIWLTEQKAFQELAGVELRERGKN